MKKLFTFSIIASIFIGLIAIVPVLADMGDLWTGGWDYTNSTDYWVIESDGDLVPGTDNTVDIGASGTEVAAIYAETLSLGTPLTAANMADVERVLPFTVGNFTESGNYLTALSADTAPGYENHNNSTAIVWDDGEATPVQLMFKVPADYSSGGAFRAVCDEDGSATASEVDFAVYVNADGGAAWDSSTTNQTPVALAVQAGTPELVTLSVATDFASLAAGDIVTLQVWRDDTANGTNNLELYYLEFYYTATQ